MFFVEHLRSDVGVLIFNDATMDSKWTAKRNLFLQSCKNFNERSYYIKKDKLYLIKTMRNILDLENDTNKEVKSSIVSDHPPITRRKIQYQI